MKTYIQFRKQAEMERVQDDLIANNITFMTRGIHQILIGEEVQYYIDVKRSVLSLIYTGKKKTRPRFTIHMHDIVTVGQGPIVAKELFDIGRKRR